MSSDPFHPTPEQVAEAVAKDKRLASIARRDAEIVGRKPALDAAVDAALLKAREYRETVILPAERAYREALRGLRPLDGVVRSARAAANILSRKRIRLRGLHAGRVVKIKETLARKNLIEGQKDLIAKFRQRRRQPRRSLQKPEYMNHDSHPPEGA